MNLWYPAGHAAVRRGHSAANDSSSSGPERPHNSGKSISTLLSLKGNFRYTDVVHHSHSVTSRTLSSFSLVSKPATLSGPRSVSWSATRTTDRTTTPRPTTTRARVTQTGRTCSSTESRRAVEVVAVRPERRSVRLVLPVPYIPEAANLDRFVHISDSDRRRMVIRPRCCWHDRRTLPQDGLRCRDCRVRLVGRQDPHPRFGG